MVISAVVLAAGGSTRMGMQKLRLPLHGVPIVRRTVHEVMGAGADEVVVVTGFESALVAEALDGLDIRFVHNPDFATGMGSSFRAAVLAIGASDAAMFALADQPFVQAVDYQRLLATYRAGPHGIVCVRYGDVTAPPHVFSRQYFAELAALEHGARPVLQRHRDQMTVLQFSPDRLMDIDTPADYERAAARFAER